MQSRYRTEIATVTSELIWNAGSAVIMGSAEDMRIMTENKRRVDFLIPISPSTPATSISTPTPAEIRADTLSDIIASMADSGE